MEIDKTTGAFSQNRPLLLLPLADAQGRGRRVAPAAWLPDLEPRRWRTVFPSTERRFPQISARGLEQRGGAAAVNRGAAVSV